MAVQQRALADRALQLLDLVQLADLGNRYPAQLSGGQRQRVALARALAVEPKLLLLDEPFGALDAKVRKDLRRWLRTLHEQMGLTSIFVTHDQDEALELADRVAVMDHGVIEQVGTPDQIYMHPHSGFVSDFVGDTNSLPVDMVGGTATFHGQSIFTHIGALAEGAARLDFRPHDVTIAEDSDGCLPIVVSAAYRKGGVWRVEGQFAGKAAPIEVDIDSGAPRPQPGQRLSLKIERAQIFSRQAAA